MNLKIAMILIMYWSLFTVVYTVGDSVIGNPFSSSGSINADINASGFSSDELDSGGFFSGVLGVFTALGRFFEMAVFGLTTGLEGTVQVLFSTWQLGFTLFTIGFIIDSVWSG